MRGDELRVAEVDHAPVDVVDLGDGGADEENEADVQRPVGELLRTLDDDVARAVVDRLVPRVDGHAALPA